MRMVWLKKIEFFCCGIPTTQKAECEAQMEGDRVLPKENFEYASICIF
jgi:hypothetical protein